MDSNLVIINAAKQPKIKDVPIDDKLVQLSAIIAKTFSRKGIQSNAKDNVEIAENVNERLMEVLPSITLHEINEACRKGVYGEYGEFYGINAVSIVNWCNEYYYSEEREHAIRVANQRKPQQTNLLGEPDDDSRIRSMIRALYSDIKMYGKFFTKLVSPKVIGFNYLVKQGIIKDSDAKVAAMMEKMKDNKPKPQGEMERLVGDNNDLENRAKANVLFVELKAMEECPV